MAFLINRTLTCDIPKCNAEFTIRCRSNYELALNASDGGWFIIFMKRENLHIHKCPEHRLPGDGESKFFDCDEGERKYKLITE